MPFEEIRRLQFVLGMIDRNVRRVLVCVRYGIGDVVMELPVLEALRRALPWARITALGARPATQLLDRSPYVDEVIDLNRWGFSHRWDPGPPEAPEAIVAWMDEHAFDLVLNVSNVTSGFGKLLAQYPVAKVESSRDAEQAAIGRGESGAAAIREGVRAGWGIDTDRGRLPQISLASDDREYADDLLRRIRLGEQRPFAISPVASAELKRWPLERLARIADELVDHADQPLLAFCGPDFAAGEELRRLMRRSDSAELVGPLHLLRTAALLERCRAFVCNDTGLMHMAASLGVPTLAIFGPTQPSIYRPPGDVVVTLDPSAVQCAYRGTTSLHPPLCLVRRHCLVECGPCIEHVSEATARRTLRWLLNGLHEDQAVNGAVA